MSVAQPAAAPTSPPLGAPPRGDLGGLRAHLGADAYAGFLVFLIALPLCLGISLASGYPAVAGLFTAIVGALVATLVSDSELTIKGPAAGLIVIALGAITELGQVYGAERAYPLALGVGVAAGALQVGFALLRTGVLGELFPSSAVHGMLAAIGIIIVSKQAPVALGVSAKGEPLELLRRLPEFVQAMNPAVACIGLTSLAVLFGLPPLARRYAALRRVPAPVVVLALAVPLGLAFDLTHEHTYRLLGHEHTLSEAYLVAVPTDLLRAVTFPDFGALGAWVGWKWAIMFALIGSLESLLSAKAVDLLDPWRRRTNLDRDLLAIGVGNALAASIGGLPMISEIVRSKASVDSGARTRFANLWHGAFLLACLLAIPGLLHHIPLAALSALLIYTGLRLASPREFLHVLEIGREQLLVFVGTLVCVLATDLLVGVCFGIVLKAGLHLWSGVPLRAMVQPRFEVARQGERVVVTPEQPAVFSNWIALRRRLEEARAPGVMVVLDLSRADLVDHTTMDRLREQVDVFAREGARLELEGLEDLQGASGHPLAARRRGLAAVRRVTIVAPLELEPRVRAAMTELGASGYTAIHARGAGRSGLQRDAAAEVVRLEFIVPEQVAQRALDYLRTELVPKHPVTACLETVHVVRFADFEPAPAGRPREARPAADLVEAAA